MTNNPSMPTPPSQWAVRRPGAVILFLVISIAGLATDLLSKHYVFQSFLSDPVLVDRAGQFIRQNPNESNPKEVLHQFQQQIFWRLKFTLSTNPGVVFGWSMPPWAVVSATVVTLCLVGVFFATSHQKNRSMHFALACILAGALGNLYDRLFSNVAPLGLGPIRRNVRDFIDCSELYYPWVFNVADILLVIGVVVLGLHWARAEWRRVKHCSNSSVQ